MNQQVKKKMSPEEMSEEDKQSNLPEGRRVSKSSKSKSSRDSLSEAKAVAAGDAV